MIEKDGYYYGRGTTDMKDGIVAITQAMINLKKAGFKPKRDIVVLFTGDEETNGIGAQEGRDPVARPARPSRIRPQRRRRRRRVQSRRTPAGYHDADRREDLRRLHLHRPQPRRAFVQAAQGQCDLQPRPCARQARSLSLHAQAQRDHARLFRRQGARWRKDRSATRCGAGWPIPTTARRPDIIEASESEVGLTRTRCVPTRLFGGHADNALPQLATAMVNCRIFPGEDPNAVKAELEKLVDDPTVVVTRNDDYVASLASPLRPDVVAAYTHAVQALHPGMPVFPEMSTGASDARPFRVAGIPVYGVNGAWVEVPTDNRAHGTRRAPAGAVALRQCGPLAADAAATLPANRSDDEARLRCVLLAAFRRRGSRRQSIRAPSRPSFRPRGR